jgi:flagellum-specific peptidoglycan hydrolase FlgJ
MQPFRKFDSAIEAFDAHARLLATGKPYAPFRAKLPDIRAAVYELGGGTPADPRYATAPRKSYGDTMWALISPNGNNLMQYDL